MTFPSDWKDEEEFCHITNNSRTNFRVRGTKQDIDNLARMIFELRDNTLNKKEIQVLAKFLEHEFISYENQELIEVMKKISKIADQSDELGPQSS